ncbi:MAG: hypothetical protein Q9P01_09320 [Anaerolineae bacterium]|nr:hypothetical protein [Anaerolineae bacterium]MDQ7035016.1 hypothetical protein [Anaerolineae bacterium]
MEQPFVEYHLENNSLHVFTFHNNSHKAAEEYMRLQNEALEMWIIDNHADEPFRMVIDISQSGLFPISHTLSHSLSLLRKYQQIPNRYFAYITSNRNDLLMLRQLAEGGGKDWEERRRTFPPEELSEAKAWLMGVIPNSSKESN